MPDCPRCELRKICPTGLARKAEWSGAKATAAAAAKDGPRAVKKAKTPPGKPNRPRPK